VRAWQSLPICHCERANSAGVAVPAVLSLRVSELCERGSLRQSVTASERTVRAWQSPPICHCERANCASVAVPAVLSLLASELCERGSPRCSVAASERTLRTWQSPPICHCERANCACVAVPADLSLRASELCERGSLRCSVTASERALRAWQSHRQRCTHREPPLRGFPFSTARWLIIPGNRRGNGITYRIMHVRLTYRLTPLKGGVSL
jgi:hypothetical protein